MRVADYFLARMVASEAHTPERLQELLVENDERLATGGTGGEAIALALEARARELASSEVRP